MAGGKWKVLTSAVVPQGTMLTIYKPMEDLKAVYVYAPYVPAVLHPYPLGSTPSLTILSRYAQSMIRSNGVAVCTRNILTIKMMVERIYLMAGTVCNVVVLGIHL